MVISVQFHDKEENFCGKEYDFALVAGEEIPELGSVIRLMDVNYNYLFYGTRVKVVNKKENSLEALNEVRYFID